jgi:hypothetical protein
MSTFYGGSQLVSVTSISRSTNGTSSYTVPSGHWAEVWFLTKQASEFAGSSGSVNGVEVVSGNSVNSKEFGMVASGGSISVQGFGTFYSYAGIKVYRNP